MGRGSRLTASQPPRTCFCVVPAGPTPPRLRSEESQILVKNPQVAANSFPGRRLPRSICASRGGRKTIPLAQAAPISSLTFSWATVDCALEGCAGRFRRIGQRQPQQQREARPRRARRREEGNSPPPCGPASRRTCVPRSRGSQSKLAPLGGSTAARKALQSQAQARGVAASAAFACDLCEHTSVIWGPWPPVLGPASVFPSVKWGR